jgi:hypothetical protein
VDLAGCADDACEVLHTAGRHPFTTDQNYAMNRAFRQACARIGLTGSTPVIELVAVRILELAYAGEFDPDKLAEKLVAEFGA